MGHRNARILAFLLKNSFFSFAWVRPTGALASPGPQRGQTGTFWRGEKSPWSPRGSEARTGEAPDTAVPSGRAAAQGSSRDASPFQPNEGEQKLGVFCLLYVLLSSALKIIQILHHH